MSRHIANSAPPNARCALYRGFAFSSPEAWQYCSHYVVDPISTTIWIASPRRKYRASAGLYLLPCVQVRDLCPSCGTHFFSQVWRLVNCLYSLRQRRRIAFLKYQPPSPSTREWRRNSIRSPARRSLRFDDDAAKLFLPARSRARGSTNTSKAFITAGAPPEVLSQKETWLSDSGLQCGLARPHDADLLPRKPNEPPAEGGSGIDQVVKLFLPRDDPHSRRRSR